VPGKINLPSDGREISVNLSKQSTSVKQFIRVTPRSEKFATVIAKTDRPEGVWLAGNIQLYRDGSYVGATQWNPMASEQLQFPFGRDDLIRVTKERLDQKKGTTGFIGQRAETHVTDHYAITSFHKVAVDVQVLEASPVSTSDEVKVEKKFDPKPTQDNWDQKQGVVAWEKSLAPNESLKINLDYEVIYPKEGWVSGLP
jgi:uncharacterized protein (TIGR02231 family)